MTGLLPAAKHSRRGEPPPSEAESLTHFDITFDKIVNFVQNRIRHVKFIFEKLLSRIGAGLDNRNLPYMIIGGQAVLRYGEPRLTRDIDIIRGVNIDKESGHRPSVYRNFRGIGI